MDWFNLIAIPVARSVALIVVLLTAFAYLTWFERKLLARFQVRYGPNRAGPGARRVPRPGRGCCAGPVLPWSSTRTRS